MMQYEEKKQYEVSHKQFWEWQFMAVYQFIKMIYYFCFQNWTMYGFPCVCVCVCMYIVIYIGYISQFVFYLCSLDLAY